MRWGRVGDGDVRGLVGAGLEELLHLLDECGVAAGVQLVDEQILVRVALAAPQGQQRLQARLLVRIQAQPVRLQAVDQHVQVADRAQPVGENSQPAAQLPGLCRLEGVVEDSPGGSHPPGGHAHVVQILQVGAIARAALLGLHPGEVELEDLAGGLGQAVVGKDADGPRAVRTNGSRDTFQLRRSRGVGRRRSPSAVSSPVSISVAVSPATMRASARRALRGGCPAVAGGASSQCW